MFEDKLKSENAEQLTAYSMIVSLFDQIENPSRYSEEEVREAVETMAFMSDSNRIEEVKRGFALMDPEKTDFTFEFSQIYKFFGQMNYYGLGIERNYRLARECFEKDILKEDSQTWFFLGKIYFEGLGVEQDSDKGLEYLSKSALVGNVEAKEMVEKILKEESKEKIFFDTLKIDKQTLDKIKKDKNLDIEKY